MLLDGFINIISAGLNLKSISSSEFESLCNNTQEEWEQLANLAVKQSVGGIFFDGIQTIYSNHGTPIPNSGWGKKIKAKFLSIAIQLEQRNRKQIATICKMGEFLKLQGYRMMVMKGQACALWYPKSEHRSIGDVDCYMFGDYEQGNKIVRGLGIVVDSSWYKHSEFRVLGETFENHQFFVTTRGGKSYKLLNKQLCDLLKESELEYYPNSEVLLPPVMFNALFLTYHAFIHFISEGLRLKQVLDWVMFVNKYQKDIEWFELHKLCESYKLNRFLIAMNSITVDYFGVKKKDNDMLCDSPYKDKVLHSILYDDDYIFSSGQGKWKERFRIISNIIKHRWKYRDIYQQSIVKHLWANISGFIFRTES